MSRVGRRVSRLRLRYRLVAGFVATMLVLLTGAGVFVYWRVDYALNRGLDKSLSGAAAELAPQVTASGRLPVAAATLARIDGFQVLDARGDVLDHDVRLGPDRAISRETLRDALAGPVHQEVGDLLPISPRPLRLYAVPLRSASSRGPLVLVLSVDRGERDEALRELLAQLTAAGLATLVLTALVGDLLARAALRPVEAYRRRATDIAAGAVDLRLEVTEGRDDEITRLGHTLNDMLEGLSQSLERERRFINDASHELRTPLTLLKGRLQLTMRRPRTVAEHERALAEIAEDLTRLTALADDLLELGTRETGPFAFDVEDLARSARKVVESRTTLAPAATPFGAAGALSIISAGPAPVRLDLLTQGRLMDNLLDNAALHGRAPVTVTVDTVGGWARLGVADAGDGMSEDLLMTATERFTRSAEARARPGSGLGLSLVSTVVLGAGGQLRLCHGGLHRDLGTPVAIECSHGPGMTVTVLLPLADRVADVDAGNGLEN